MNTSSVIVTGASRGMGQAMVGQLAKLGCQVVATARSEDALRALWEKNPNVRWIAADISDPETPQRLVEAALEKGGKLHALINNAGVIDPISPLSKCCPKQWARAIEINLTAPAALMIEALPYLNASQGRVVNMSSGAAVKVVEGWSAYCTSKAGLLHLTTIAAQENPKVAFFSLRPGTVDTQMQSEIRQSDGMTPEDLSKFQNLKNTDGLVSPDVPARSAVWLALQGPLARSGEFIQYTDPDVLRGVESLFAMN